MSDYIVRATAADANIRAFAVTSREMVETAREDHMTTPVMTAALGRLLSAGAMIFVVSHEVIPETHKSGQQLSATFGIMVGFCLLMLVEQMFD